MTVYHSDASVVPRYYRSELTHYFYTSRLARGTTMSFSLSPEQALHKMLSLQEPSPFMPKQTTRRLKPSLINTASITTLSSKHMGDKTFCVFVFVCWPHRCCQAPPHEWETTKGPSIQSEQTTHWPPSCPFATHRPPQPQQLYHCTTGRHNIV